MINLSTRDGVRCLLFPDCGSLDQCNCLLVIPEISQNFPANTFFTSNQTYLFLDQTYCTNVNWCTFCSIEFFPITPYPDLMKICHQQMFPNTLQRTNVIYATAIAGARIVLQLVYTCYTCYSSYNIWGAKDMTLYCMRAFWNFPSRFEGIFPSRYDGMSSVWLLQTHIIPSKLSPAKTQPKHCIALWR